MTLGNRAVIYLFPLSFLNALTFRPLTDHKMTYPRNAFCAVGNEKCRWLKKNQDPKQPG